MISQPFYSQAYRAWRIQNEGNNESIVLPTEEEAWEAYRLAQGKGWKAATNFEREVNVRIQQEQHEERERQRKAQADSPQ